MGTRRNSVPEWKVALGVLLSTYLSATLFCGLLASPVHAQTVGRDRVIVSVRATNQSNGANLEQVQLEIVQFPDSVADTAFTDSTGRATFRPVLAGTYLIRAAKPGFHPVQTSIDTRSGQTTFEASVEMLPVENSPSQPGGQVSTRELSIPEAARNEFNKGVEYLNEKKDAQQSIGHFQSAIDAFPNYYEAYFLMGMAYLETKQPKEAQDSLQKAVDLNLKFMDPYYPLAELLIAQKQFGGAEHLLQTAMHQDPQAWRWPFELAMCSAKQTKWQEAIKYGQVALGRPNPATKVHLLMADLYSNSGNAAKAVTELEAFEKLDPKSPYIVRVEQVLPQLRQRATQEAGAPTPNPSKP